MSENDDRPHERSGYTPPDPNSFWAQLEALCDNWVFCIIFLIVVALIGLNAH